MRAIVRYMAIVTLLLVAYNEASAQWMKERGLVRKGNDSYEEGKYSESIKQYEEALQHKPNSFEAKFDLASALYRTERYEKAEQMMKSLLRDENLAEKSRGEVSYNLGNVQFAQKKYKEALESYRLAMRYNPNDEDAKFNYAFTKRLLQQNEQQQQNQDNQDNQQNQDQQQDNQQNQQNKDNKENNENENNDKQDENNQNQQQNQQDNQQDQQEDKEQQPQNGNNDKQEGGVKPEQEALLQAIQAEEDKTQDKLKEKAVVLIRGGKNW